MNKTEKKRVQRSKKIISLRLAYQSDAREIDLLFFEWLKFKKGGRIKEIRKAIGAKEIIVSTIIKKYNEIKQDKTIGFIHGVIHNDPISSGPLLYITAFYLKPLFRNEGIGSQMLNLIIKKAIEESSIEGVEVATARRRAFRLYKRFGFSQFKGDFGEMLLNLDARKWKQMHLSKTISSRTRAPATDRCLIDGCH